MRGKPRGVSALAGLLLGSLLAVPTMAQDIAAVIAAEEARIERARNQQRQIDQIAEQTRRRVEELQVLNREIEGLRVFNGMMQARVNAQERELAELRASIDTVTLIERQVTPLMTRMIDGLERFIRLDVPFRLEQRLKNVDDLRGLLTEHDVSVAEQFRLVMQAWQTEVDYGSFADSYTAEVELDGVTREVDYLMLGRVGFFYVTPDNALAAAWDQSAREWIPLSRTDAEQIRLGLDSIASGRPNLLMLPVAPPQEN